MFSLFVVQARNAALRGRDVSDFITLCTAILDQAIDPLVIDKTHTASRRLSLVVERRNAARAEFDL